MLCRCNVFLIFLYLCWNYSLPNNQYFPGVFVKLSNTNKAIVSIKKNIMIWWQKVWIRKGEYVLIKISDSDRFSQYLIFFKQYQMKQWTQLNENVFLTISSSRANKLVWIQQVVSETQMRRTHIDCLFLYTYGYSIMIVQNHCHVHNFSIR